MEADKPFDSTALADTVLKSSDNVHFYVLGAFLRYVSPIFHDLFRLSRGSASESDENEIKDGYPVIPLPEDSKTVHYLLSIIHPYINRPKLDDSRLLHNVWKMAEKYGMDTVVGKLQKQLLGDQWMKDQPHRVFAIATIFGWQDGAEKAKQTLASWEEVPYCDLFEDISGTDYYGLWEYHFRRAAPGERQAEQDEKDTSVDNTVDSTHSSSSGVDTSGLLNSFSNSKVDVILRSSDGVDFYLSRPFLQLFSSAFDESLSGAKRESKNGLTVVCVTDDSKALHYFLFALHQPMEKLPVENPGLIVDICLVARKYCVAIVEARLKEQLATSSSLVENPLCVYAIAIALGWGDVAKAAAKNTLNVPVEKAVTRIPELRGITGADLYRLIDYRTKCTKAACDVLENNQVHRAHGPNHIVSNFRVHGPYGMMIYSQSLNNVETELAKELAKCPRGSTYRDILSRLMNVVDDNRGTVG
ncbi:hypothetical protein AX14_008086 [Amanita brunnescens Koide BX004]|nr:hypothetical protein AX14_008086 [Amanita brunnescens Koide BX004]